MTPSPINSAGCFVDLYELPAHHGKLRRLYGPAVYVLLRGRGTECDVRIESLIVGPDAFALWYDHRDPERNCLWLGPGQSISNWSGAGLHKAMDSLQLLDHAPKPGEPCAGAYPRKLAKS